MGLGLFLYNCFGWSELIDYVRFVVLFYIVFRHLLNCMERAIIIMIFIVIIFFIIIFVRLGLITGSDGCGFHEYP